LVTQPANAVSSLAYVVAGATMHRSSRRAVPRRSTETALAWATVAVGMGSVAYHGPGGAISRYAHDASLIAMLGFIALSDAERLAGEPVPTGLAVVPLVAAVGAAPRVSPTAQALAGLAAAVAEAARLHRTGGRADGKSGRAAVGPGNRSDGFSGSFGRGPGGGSGHRSGDRSGVGPGHRSGNDPGDGPGHRSGDRSGVGPGHRSGNRSGVGPGHRSGNGSDRGPSDGSADGSGGRSGDRSRRGPDAATWGRRLAGPALAVGLAAQVFGRTGGPWCRPDSLFQPHALWHALTASALWARSAGTR
jgi:hypothetical protein